MNRSRELTDAIAPLSRFSRGRVCDGDCTQPSCDTGGDSDCDKVIFRTRMRRPDQFRAMRPLRAARLR